MEWVKTGKLGGLEQESRDGWVELGKWNGLQLKSRMGWSREK